MVRATSAETFTRNTWARTGCRVGLVVQKGHSVFNYLVINHPSSGPGTLSEPALLGCFLMISGLTPTLLASALGATKTLGKPAGGRGDHTPSPGAADSDEYRLFSKRLPCIEGFLAGLTPLVSPAVAI